MQRNNLSNEDKNLVVIVISLTYAVCIGSFAVVRFLDNDWVMTILDVFLASFALSLAVYTWITKRGRLTAYAIALISVIGTLVTLYLKGPEQVYWAYPSVALVFYLLPIRHAILVWMASIIITVFLLKDIPSNELLSISMTLVITCFFCYFFSVKMEKQNLKLHNIANEDVLTKVLNRRAFNQDIEHLNEVNKLESGILFDLDQFKQVNDLYGHARGDEVLKGVTEFVESYLSCETRLYRIGGDEFALIGSALKFDFAFQLANKILTDFNDSQIHKEHDITLSMAVAQKIEDETISDWLGRLDGSLYKAKKSGRNQIIKSIRQ